MTGLPGASRRPHHSRRGSSRREVLLPCQAVRERDFKLVADRIFDVSPEGMMLPLLTRVLTGETLIISFAIPGLWIDVEGTVARIVHGRRPEDDGLAMGVLFDRIAPSARAALAGFLHGRRAPLPRRGPMARLRRGGDLPQLADEGIMQLELPQLVDPNDVMEMDEDCDEVDGLDVLRAVVGAWQSLVTPSPLQQH